MYRACKLPLAFDARRLLADLALAEASHWQPHFVTRNYTGDWSVIPLRSVAGRADHIHSDASVPVSDYAPTPVLARCPYFQEVLGRFACPVSSARLMKLAAGSHIKEHVDHDLSVARGTARLHIPISTNPEVEFHIEDERVRMAAGECWYIDATLRHRLANLGATDRVHLVFDCEVNDWLRAQLAQAGYRPRPLGFLEARGVRRQDLGRVVAALQAMGTPVAAALARELGEASGEGDAA